MRKLRVTVDLGVMEFILLAVAILAILFVGVALALAIDDVAQSCATR